MLPSIKKNPMVGVRRFQPGVCVWACVCGCVWVRVCVREGKAGGTLKAQAEV